MADAATEPDGILVGLCEDSWHGGGSSHGRMTDGQLVVLSAVQLAARLVGTQVAHKIFRGVLGGLQRTFVP